MIVQGLRVAALFVGYGAVGMGGDYAAEALGRALSQDDVRVPVERVVEVDVRVEPRVGRDEDDCRYEASRTVTLDADDARALLVRAGSGELEVEGRAGLARIEAEARACASDEGDLADLTLSLDREGADLVLEAHYPDRSGRRSWNGNHYARLDLVVHMPLGMDTDLSDSSGGMIVSGTGNLDIDDSSGSISVRDAAGSVTIDDSSGEVEVEGVKGDVEVRDGSGEIEVSGVEGSVRIRDGSGSVDVADVARDVVVLGDGSGSISVRDVGGDFQVRADGSGGIRHYGVAGAVDIPRDKRRDRRGG